MTEKQITIVVGVILNNNGEILLVKRNQPDIPEEHNKWEFPGGSIAFGEDPEQALTREVKEETGLDIKIVRLLPKILSNVWEKQNPKRQIIMLNYECLVKGGEIQIGQEPEISELKFIKIDDVKNYDTLPNVEKTIELLFAKH